MAKIVGVRAREMLDSRGNPTVEAELASDTGLSATAIVPSGASTGQHEACELRDGDPKRYLGKGVLKAVANVTGEVAKTIAGLALGDQAGIDALLIKLDGTENKSRLGANAILAVSLAYARLSALSRNVPLYRYFAELDGNAGRTLPVPMMNILNGGAHADNNLDLQEIMIVPAGFRTFSEALRAGAEVFHHLKKLLSERGSATAVGDEGGFAPEVASNDAAVAIVTEAIGRAGYRPGEDIAIAIDAAASGFFKAGKYRLSNDPHPEKSSSDMTAYYTALGEKYPIVSLEDGLDENDWEGWKTLTKALGKKIQLVGDDVFVTNEKLLRRGIENGIANAILIKLNQIGTVSETLETIRTARKAGYRTVISHRSGETEDTVISDLAVGTDAGQIKTGSLCRTDRVAKYNRLLRIAEELGPSGRFPGRAAFGGGF